MLSTRARIVCLVTMAATVVHVTACGSSEPVLPGVPTPRLSSGKAAPAADETPEGYVRPAGVVLDVQHICGHALSEVRGEVLEQLGALVRSEKLPAGRGESLLMERGELRVLEDRAYMLRLPLPEPMRRADVLRIIGLPPQVSETIQTHREYRLNHERGFRRIRMIRQSRKNELVTEVEVWQFIPGEHVGRR